MDSQKKAVKKYRQKRQQEGWRRLPGGLIPPEAADKLNSLSAKYGSKMAAIAAAIDKLHDEGK